MRSADSNLPGQVDPSVKEPSSVVSEPQQPPLFLGELSSYVARAVFCLAPVYLAGYLGLSTVWLLAGLFLWMWWRRNRRGKRSRLAAAFGLLEDEKQAINQGIAFQQLPAWVHFPDVERVEWLNKIIEQAWPYFGTILEKTLREVVVPKIRAKNVHLKTFTFTKIHFGDKCPKIKGVKTYTREADKQQVMVDLQIWQLGIGGRGLYGTLRVILEPLMTDLPFIGALTVFFIQKPHLEINWAGLTNLLDAPGISLMSDTLIQDLIAARLVLPNRITVPLMKNLDVSQLRFPIPYGVIRVYLLEAENLVPKDHFSLRGKSDPYALLRVGTVQFRSKTIQRDLNPIWNEMFEVWQVWKDLEIDVYDEDTDKDDFLGSLLINLRDVMKDRIVDEWFPLSKIESGHLHLKLEWSSLVTDQEKLGEDKNGLATALLIVYLDSACNLPKNHFEYSNGEYGAKKFRNNKYLKLKMPQSFSLFPQTCNFTKDPVWGQAFTFFVHSALSQSLHLEIKDKERENALGTLVVSLSHLLKDLEMMVDERFLLDHSGSDSFVKMKLVLRVMCIEEPNPENVYTGVNAVKQVPIPATEDGGNQGRPVLVPLSKPDVSKIPQGGKEPEVAETESKQPRKESNADLQGNGNLAAPVTNETLAGCNEQAGAGNLEPRPVSALQTIPAAPLLPAVEELRLAPSVASLGSLASLNFGLSHSNLDLLPNGTNTTQMPMGELHLTVRYASLRQSLIVLINGCRNLIPCSRLGANPYVRVYLLPDKRWTSRKRTTVRRQTLNPQYDEKFEFFDSLEDVKKRSLNIAVKNKRPFVSHERKELGKVLISLSNKDLIRVFSQW
uniref:Extended synaptotagmin-3 n=1 Tax=Sphenodon punctatus TaxID=8508 RepID=A0A8D0HB73_SPHPU